MITRVYVTDEMMKDYDAFAAHARKLIISELSKSFDGYVDDEYQKIMRGDGSAEPIGILNADGRKAKGKKRHGK